MKSRAWKYAALVMSGGIMMQFAGCTTLVGQLLYDQILSAIVAALTAALSGSA